MPELPEVERASRRPEGGAAAASSRSAAPTIPSSSIGASRANPSGARGRRVQDVKRHGKHLWFELDRRRGPAYTSA